MGRLTLILCCLLAFQVLVTLQQKQQQQGNGNGVQGDGGGRIPKKQSSGGNGGKRLKKTMNPLIKTIKTIRKSKKVGGNKNKNQLKKLRIKKKMNRLRQRKAKKANKNVKQSCSATQIPETEFVAMIECLEFERNQINNFKQQRSRMGSQVRIINSKSEKKNDFLVPAENLGFALNVNETDQSNATCGDGLSAATTRDAGPALALYLGLLNCTNSSVPLNCDTSLYNDTTEAVLVQCDKLILDMAQKNIDCRNRPIGEVGTCWTNIKTGVMQEIRDLKCNQYTAALSKAVADQRTTCINAFAACKRFEDEAVLSSSLCARGTVKTLEEINKQTIITKETIGLGSARALNEDDDDEDDDEFYDYDDIFPDLGV